MTIKFESKCSVCGKGRGPAFNHDACAKKKQQARKQREQKEKQNAH